MNRDWWSELPDTVGPALLLLVLGLVVGYFAGLVRWLGPW